MPIVVTCPGCPAKLSAPDNAAGKQIRCPKCGAAAPVPDLIPAEEVPVVEAALIPPKPKPKPVEAEAVEEERPRKKATRRDDDDEDEAPRKKKKRRYDDDDDDYDHDHPRRRRRSGGGGNGGKIAVIVVGGILLLVGLGVGIYFLTSKGGPLAKKTPLPPGWQVYSYPQDKFKAPFPKEPQVMTMQAGAFPMGGMGGMGPMRGGRFGGGMEIPEVESVSTYISGLMQPDEQVTIQVTIARFKKEIPRAMRDQVNQITSGQVGGLETRKVRWLGYDAGEIIVAGSLTRVVYTDRMMILVQISGRNGSRAKPEEEAAFFDNFELTK